MSYADGTVIMAESAYDMDAIPKHKFYYNEGVLENVKEFNN